MITVVDDRLRQEARRYEFRFTCEDCALYVAERGTCAHEFPNAMHQGVDIDRATHVLFCKEFELA